MSRFEAARSPLFQSVRILGQLLAVSDLTPEQQSALCRRLDCDEPALARLLDEVTWAWDFLRRAESGGEEARHRALLALAQAGDAPGVERGHRYTVLLGTGEHDEHISPLRPTVEEAVVDAWLHARASGQPVPTEWRYGDPQAGDVAACGRPEGEAEPCYSVLRFDDPQDAVLDQAVSETLTLLERRMDDLDPGDDPTSAPRKALLQLRHALGRPLRRLITVGRRSDRQVLAEYEVSHPDTAICLIHAFVTETLPRDLIVRAWSEGAAEHGRWFVEVTPTELPPEPLRPFSVQGPDGRERRFLAESAEHLHALVQEAYDLHFPDSGEFQDAVGEDLEVTSAAGHRLTIHHVPA